MIGMIAASLSIIVTLIELLSVAVRIHVASIAFSSALHALFRISSPSTVIAPWLVPSGGAQTGASGIHPGSPAVMVLKVSCKGMVGSMSTRHRAIPKPSAAGLPAASMAQWTTVQMYSCKAWMAC